MGKRFTISLLGQGPSQTWPEHYRSVTFSTAKYCSAFMVLVSQFPIPTISEPQNSPIELEERMGDIAHPGPICYKSQILRDWKASADIL